MTRGATAPRVLGREWESVVASGRVSPRSSAEGLEPEPARHCSPHLPPVRSRGLASPSGPRVGPGRGEQAPCPGLQAPPDRVQLGARACSWHGHWPRCPPPVAQGRPGAAPAGTPRLQAGPERGSPCLAATEAAAGQAPAVPEAGHAAAGARAGPGAAAAAGRPEGVSGRRGARGAGRGGGAELTAPPLGQAGQAAAEEEAVPGAAPGQGGEPDQQPGGHGKWGSGACPPSHPAPRTLSPAPPCAPHPASSRDLARP